MSTTKKIEELTPEQTAAMPVYAEKWINKGTNTDRLNYDDTLDIIHNLQTKILNQKTTPVVIFNNPIECWIACHLSVYKNIPVNDLKKEVDAFFLEKKHRDMKLENFVMPYLVGSFDAGIFSFYDYSQKELGIDYKEYSEKFEIWKKTSEIGLIFPLENVCIVSEKPTVIKLNEAKLAHCDGGPAISYAGHGDLNVFILNNVIVPEWLAVTKGTDIPLERYTELDNADVKMEFVKKVGIERMLSTGKKLDSYENYTDPMWHSSEYELWDMAHLFPNIPYAPHLKMLNQTTKVWHVEAVSPDCRNLVDAMKDRFGGRDLEIIAIA